jgi:hypothetical protein
VDIAVRRTEFLARDFIGSNKGEKEIFWKFGRKPEDRRKIWRPRLKWLEDLENYLRGSGKQERILSICSRNYGL